MNRFNCNGQKKRTSRRDLYESHIMRPKKTSLGGRGGTRTLMRFLSQRPERCVATNYTTRPVNVPKMTSSWASVGNSLIDPNGRFASFPPSSPAYLVHF